MDILGLLIVVVIVGFPVLLFKYLKRQQEYDSLIDKIPGPKKLPILGNALDLAGVPNTELLKHEVERFRKYGAVVRAWIGPVATIHLHSAETCEPILCGMRHIEKSFVYNFLHRWLGQGLLTSSGSKWQTHRKMITPTFHFKILENFHEVMVEKSEILVKRLEKVSSDCKEFDIFPYITHAALDIICETAMGTNVGAQNSVHNTYVAAIYTLSELIIHRITKPWLMFDPIYYLTSMGKESAKALEQLHGFTRRVIQERKVARKVALTKSNLPHMEDPDIDLGKKKKVAFLDLLLDVADGDVKLTDDDIREEVDTFMFEGHDTTTSGICWTIYLLGCNPQIQERAYEEIHEIFNGDDRPISFQDVGEMKYLERVIKESLRLYPPVPTYGRKTDEEILCGGYKIPAETYVFVHTYTLHRDPKQFPNPLVFNPDNFLPERVKSRHPFAYLPFSAGPRNCIGQKFAMMEEKTVVASILRKFKIVSTEKLENIVLMSELILRPQSGIKVILQPR